MNASTSTTRHSEWPWISGISGYFPSPPKFLRVTASVAWRLAELNCANVNRSLAHSLDSLRALSEVRDVASFVAQQQKSMGIIWNDQKDAAKAAADVIRTGFQALQTAQTGSASAASKPHSAAHADTDKIAPAGAVFEIYTDKAGEYRFRLKATDGSVLLRSEGYKSRASAVNGVTSVKKNATIDARYDKRASATGKSTFNLKAGNHQIIGSSATFASADQMEAAINLIQQTVATAKVDDQTRAGD